MKELLDGESEHVAAKVGLRLLENERLLAPAGGSGPVINHFGNGPVGIVVDWKSSRDKSPYTEEERANLRKFMSEAEVEQYIAERAVSSKAIEGEAVSSIEAEDET